MGTLFARVLILTLSLVPLLGLTLASCQAPGESGNEPAAQAAAVAPAESPADGKGQIASEQPVFDYGTVPQGTVVQHTFTVRNTGDGVLRIQSARAGCGCTTAIVSDPDLPPGGEARIEVKLNTRGRKGRFEQKIKVVTEGNAEPFVLTLGGNVDILASFDPEFLDFQRVPVGQARTATVKVTARDQAGLSLGTVTTSDPERLDAITTSVDGQPALAVTFKASDTPGVWNGRVTVKTGLAQTPEIHLTVRAHVSLDLLATPDRLLFPLRTEGEPDPVREIQVSSLSGKTFKIRKVEDDSGSVSSVVRKTKDGTFISMTLVKTPDNNHGTVTLTTDRKDQPTIDVTYTAGSHPPARLRRVVPPGGPLPMKPGPGPIPPAPRPMEPALR
jgi:hypothetical protein